MTTDQRMRVRAEETAQKMNEVGTLSHRDAHTLQPLRLLSTRPDKPWGGRVVTVVTPSQAFVLYCVGRDCAVSIQVLARRRGVAEAAVHYAPYATLARCFLHSTCYHNHAACLTKATDCRP